MLALLLMNKGMSCILGLVGVGGRTVYLLKLTVKSSSFSSKRISVGEGCQSIVEELSRCTMLTNVSFGGLHMALPHPLPIFIGLKSFRVRFCSKRFFEFALLYLQGRPAECSDSLEVVDFSHLSTFPPQYRPVLKSCRKESVGDFGGIHSAVDIPRLSKLF